MKEQKNIERLFQEKFKDFEAIPPENSWEIIASRLNEKKKKKRVIPFWFQLSGIAASLIIVGTLIWNYQSEKSALIQDNNNTIVSEDANIKINNNANSGIENAAITSSESNELNQNTSEKNKLEENSNQNKINTNSITKSKNAVVSISKSNKKNNSTLSSFTNSKGNIVDNTKGNKISKNKKNSAKNNDILTSNNELIGNENVLDNSNDKNLVTHQKKKSIDKTNNKDINSDKIDVFFEKDNKETTLTNNTNADLKENNGSNTIVASTEISTKDSTLVAKIAEEKNPLEELLAAKEEGKNEDEKEKEKRSKWAISSNAAPIYFNSMAEGSSLDQQFKNNAKNYSTTLSYGIGGSYMVSNKVSIRTGINNINLSYSTNDVMYQTKLNSAVNNNIPTISRNSNGSNVIFESKNAIKNTLSGDIENVSINNSGSIKQDLSYLEVPVELSYKIIDKKIGIEVIGGMSTLFLNNNTISLVTDGMEMNVGKANNLNNIHFSSNVGLGFKYSFWKNFNATFQPMFKYQIKTFSENSGNFKPYFIGLYSGISFSF
jgi:hypothetical protein